MTLRARLTLFVAVAVGIAVAVVALFAYRFARDEAVAEVDRFLQERGPVVGLLGTIDFEDLRPRPFGGGQGSGPGAGQGLSGLSSVVRADAIAQFIDATGTVISFDDEGVLLPVTAEDLERASSRSSDLIRDVTVDDVHYRMLTRHIGPGLAIQVARDMTGTDEILAGLRLRLMLLALAGATLAGAVGWIVSRRSLRPVDELTAAAAHVADTRELDARIEVARADELGQLAESFNSMLAALEEARSGQQRLVADASHELRTPLTSLRTNIELLARNAVADADRQELLDDVHSELQELTHLVGELVDLATIGREEEPEVDLDLADVVAQAVQRIRRRATSDIVLDTEPTPIRGRPTSLLRALANLLDNAVKWGEGSGPIEVTLAGGTLRVRDHGPGIPPEDADHVFERFYRSPAARSQPGSGLGLSIVAAVVAEHGGTVFAENAPDGGALIGFTLPPSGE